MSDKRWLKSLAKDIATHAECAALIAKLDDALVKVKSENERLRKELSEAAMEIHCAGPIAHRIRVLRAEMGEWCRQYHAERDALNIYVDRLCAEIERLRELVEELEEARYD